MVPEKFFLTCGSGRDPDSLISFGIALEDAGIGKFNLVPVSSIVPPRCELIDKEEGLKLLSPGQIVHCVLARIRTQKEESIAAGIGVAFPEVQGPVGCIFEFTSIDKGKSIATKESEKGARELLKRSLGIKVGRSLSIAKEAIGVAGAWTTVVASAVFV